MRKRTKSSSAYPLLLPILLLLSISVNLYFILTADFQIGAVEKLSLQELQELKEPGVYGPEGIEIVEGSLYICAPEITLQNALIEGDLVLMEAIGEGSAALRGVSVEGTARVEGGGEDSVIIEDSSINHLVINKKVGKVRVLLKGDTVIERVTLEGEAILSTVGLSKKGAVRELYVETAARTELEGSYSLVNVAAKEARVNLDGGRVKRLITGPEAEEAAVSLGKGAVVDLLEAGAPLTLVGEGRAKKVIVEASGLFKLSANMDELTACGRGIFLELEGGSTGTLLIKDSPGKVMIHLADKAAIEDIVLNGTAGITGGGTVGRVKINKTGSSIEQKPGSVELAVGITAEVAGEKLIKEEQKPEPPPSPAPSSSSSAPKATSSPVKEFTVDDSCPVLGHKGVVVKLSYSDPHNYTVTVGKTKLDFYPDVGKFGGVVPENDAKLSKVRVTKK